MCAELRRLVLGLLLAGAALSRTAAQDATRVFEFDTTTYLPAGFAAAGDVEVWIPVPVSNGYQEVAVLGWRLADPAGEPLDCGAAVELAAEPVTGDTLLHLRVPHGDSPALAVLARYRVERHALRRDARPDGSGVEDPAARLGPDRLVPLDGDRADRGAGEGWGRAVRARPGAPTSPSAGSPPTGWRSPRGATSCSRQRSTACRSTTC